MDVGTVYLLIKYLPIDRHSGLDMRYMNLCPFIDEVFHVDTRRESTSGEYLSALDHEWNATRLEALEDIGRFLQERPDGVWIAGDYDSFCILKSLGVKKLVYDNCDSQSFYYARRFRVLPWRQWKKKINSVRQWLIWSFRERQIMRHCAGVVVTAEKDRQAFLRWGDGRVVVVSCGTSWIEKPPIKRRADAHAIMFHGVFSWHVNTTTAEFLVRELFPEVRRFVPDCELHIAGHPTPQSLKADAQKDGIYLEGFVEDLEEWLSGCGVYAMPMFQGGGVKNKLLESMAAGLPVVTNEMGAEAMSADARKHFVVAEGRDAMVAAVVELLRNRDKADALAANARAYAVDHFSWETEKNKYRDLVVAVADHRE